MNRRGVIGIDIGGTNIKAGIVDTDGHVVHKETIPTEARAGKEALLTKIESLIDSFRAQAPSLGIEVSGVGIGTAGYVNREGVIGTATENLPGWSGTRLKEVIEQQIQLPVRVDNDVNAMALGEVWLGAGRPWDHFLCVALGTGVGGCLIENKRPYRGRSGYAGGYGHQVIEIQGHPCTCGLRGCWEQYASVTALKRMSGEMGEEAEIAQQSPERLFAMAREGHLVALQIVERYADYIAIGLANLIHIFNPPAIVIGGAVTAQGEFLFERIRKYVSMHTLNVYVENPELPIVPAILGDMAGMIGSARLALDAVVDRRNE
ncbi:ROK family protein [Paenibacillus sp. GCM10027628]|uniref:ROK family protein n=1 Tax=Paenibacillus sp. GCM10027628 TaxID=3273413 RepID=UPI003630180E